jgi:hypothetical protein
MVVSRKLELPDDVYDALREAAEANGMTPAEWVSSRLPTEKKPTPKSLAERFAGRVGRVSSGGRERLSEDGGRKFADYLEAKGRSGRL